ncbi:MAG: hypothetical protein K9J74_11035 [Sulfuritalea sp.]|nr:hypothetical protein [Sulfuritalea sp.]
MLEKKSRLEAGIKTNVLGTLEEETGQFGASRGPAASEGLASVKIDALHKSTAQVYTSE